MLISLKEHLTTQEEGEKYMRRFITPEEAEALLPDGNEVHTFYQMGNTLVGADWDKTEIIEELSRNDRIEIVGEEARSMGHGLAVYNHDTKWQSDVLFVETDTDKLKPIDGEIVAWMPLPAPYEPQESEE